jgi:hypothetical protein
MSANAQGRLSANAVFVAELGPMVAAATGIITPQPAATSTKSEYPRPRRPRPKPRPRPRPYVGQTFFVQVLVMI